MYIKELQIKNFGCFARAEVTLNYPGRRSSRKHPTPTRFKNVNLFLGNNGSGKSTVFRAAALSVIAPIASAESIPMRYRVRRMPEEWSVPADSLIQSEATIKGDLLLHSMDTTDGTATLPSSLCTIQRTGDFEAIDFQRSTLASEPEWQKINEPYSPAFFVAGYGASRRLQRPEGVSEITRGPRYQRVAGLFEEGIGLTPFEDAHNELESLGFLTEGRQLLNKLLPDGVQLTERTDSERHPLFFRSGLYLPFTALSDGFRAYVGWVWDLLLQLARVQAEAHLPVTTAAKLVNVRGVVVVDEIDLFLHPLWQQQVVQKTAESFPQIQFLFSTHSPLVVGTLEAANLFMLDTNNNGSATISRYQEEVHGLTANQVLTSSYFALPSTIAPDANRDDSLLRKALSEDSAERADFVQAMLESIPSE